MISHRRSPIAGPGDRPPSTRSSSGFGHDGCARRAPGPAGGSFGSIGPGLGTGWRHGSPSSVILGATGVAGRARRFHRLGHPRRAPGAVLVGRSPVGPFGRPLGPGPPPAEEALQLLPPQPPEALPDRFGPRPR